MDGSWHPELVEAQELDDLLHTEGSQNLEDDDLHMRDEGDGGEGNEDVHLLGDLVIRREASKGLDGAFRVSDIGELLDTSLLQHIVDFGGQVILTHLRPSEVPKLILVAVVDLVGHGDAIATIVSKPHVITHVGKEVSQAIGRRIQSHTRRIVCQAVLEKNDTTRRISCLSSRDSLHNCTNKVRQLQLKAKWEATLTAVCQFVSGQAGAPARLF